MPDLLPLNEYWAMAGGAPTTGGGPEQQVTALITYAEAILRSKIARLDERIAAGSLDRTLVAGVIFDAVSLAAESLSVGRRTRSNRYPEYEAEYFAGDTVTAGLVTFTDDQLDLLAEPAAAGEAFTILPGPFPGRRRDGW